MYQSQVLLKMSECLYKWESGFDHSWIAEDKSGNVAYFACCLDDAFPCNVRIDKRLMAGLDSRLKAHLGVKDDNWTGIFDLLSSKGLYVYDAVRTAGDVAKYVLVGRPDSPVLSDSLPPSLKAVASRFAIRELQFARCEQLPVCNLFGGSDDDLRYLGLYRRAIGAICECGTPGVSVSKSQNLGFARAEWIERGGFDMHAVMGFGDVGVEVATLYKWDVYVDFFKALLHNISSLNRGGEICAHSGDGCWVVGEKCVSDDEFLERPPTIVRLKDRSGVVDAELKLDLDCLTSCAARADSCRYLIHGSYERYVAIKKAIADSAFQVGIQFSPRTPSRNWISRILARWR